MTKFDFKDGNGPVPAHQHPNGGGWVADTATVADTAYVNPNAKVFGNAVVSDYAVISGYAKVFSNARVFDNAKVSGNAQVSGNARVFGSTKIKRGYYECSPLSVIRSDGYTFTLQSDASIIAGCRDFTKEKALEHWGDINHHKHAESMAIVNALYAIEEARNAK